MQNMDREPTIKATRNSNKSSVVRKRSHEHSVPRGSGTNCLWSGPNGDAITGAAHCWFQATAPRTRGGGYMGWVEYNRRSKAS